MTSFVTGATPKTAGVYYDDSYDRTLYAPGNNCAGNPKTGNPGTNLARRFQSGGTKGRSRR